MNLEQLAIKYGTDKRINGGHGYTYFYEEMFEPRRDDPNINFLELGVREGWSLKMWDEYFTHAKIFGIDNNSEGLCPSSFESKKISFTLCSQTDKDALLNMANNCGGFDIIVDDASHISELSINSFEILFPTLRSGGIYVIEDLHVCHIPMYNPKNFSTHQYIDTIRYRGDIIIREFLNRKICFIQKVL
jgi:cephalosporin hydroxylase